MKGACLLLVGVIGCFCSAWAAGIPKADIFNPYMGISKVTIDTVSLTVPSKVTIQVTGVEEPALRNVTAWIDTGEGFKIISQPSVKLDLLASGKTFTFTATIQAESKGIWPITVRTKAICYDATRACDEQIFYLVITDTLSGLLTGYEAQFLTPQTPAKLRQLPPGAIKRSPPSSPGRRAKAGVADTLMKPRARPGKRSGTFDVIGSLLYHDPRDPQGWLRPAASVSVEVWNDNEYDNPLSQDA